MITLYVIICLLGCLDYYFHYKFITYIKKDLTQKQKAHILSIKASLTLTLIGILFNYYYFASGFNKTKFLYDVENKESLNFGMIVVMYFISYLITDIYVGNKEYPEYMQTLSGNFHHISYIIINILSLLTGLYPLYLLHMISELPTVIMSLGSFDSDLRNDNLFGTVFFITRIIYHSILTFMFREHKIVLGFSLITLALHIYWFYGWFKKYGKTLFTFKNSKSNKNSKNSKSNKNSKPSKSNKNSKPSKSIKN
jgi:hypothetical protein